MFHIKYNLILNYIRNLLLSFTQVKIIQRFTSFLMFLSIKGKKTTTLIYEM